MVKDVYRRCPLRNEFQKLFRLIDWFLQLPKPQELTYNEELKKSEEEKRMPYITTPERYGLQAGLREAIQIELELRYGAEGTSLMPAVEKLDDLDRLRLVFRKVAHAAPLDEVRALLAGQ